MARTVQELTYRLVADEKQLVAGLRSASERTKALGKQFEKTGKSLTKGLTLPIVAAGGAMVKLALDAGNTADRLLDLSEITGLSTDTLQELDVVAAQAGVSSEGLARSIQRFSQRLPQLESGTGNSADALARLGVSLRDGNGEIREADDLLPDFLKSLEQVESTVERNALAQQIFGRSLDDLAPVIALGSDEFDRLRQSARDSGAVIGRDALEAANDFRAEVDQLQVRLQRARQEIGNELIPVIQDLIPAFEDALRTVIGAFQAFTDLDESTQKLILTVAGIAAVAGPAAIAIGKLSAAMAFLAANPLVAVAAGLAGLGIVIARIASDYENLDERIQRSAREWASSAVEADRLLMELEGLDSTTREYEQAIDQLVNVYPGLTDEIDVQKASVEDLRNAVENLILAERQRATEDLRRSISEQTAAIQAQRDQLRRLNADLAAAPPELQQDVRRAIEDTTQVLRSQQETLVQLRAEQTAINQTYDEQLEQERARIAAAQQQREAQLQVGAAARQRQRDEQVYAETQKESDDANVRSAEQIAAARDELTRRLLRQQLSVTDDAREQEEIQLELLRRKKEEELAIEDLTEAERIQILEFYANEEQRIADQTTQALAAERKKQLDDAIAVYNQLSGYINQIGSQIFSNERARIENTTEENIKAEEDRIEREIENAKKTIQNEDNLADAIREINETGAENKEKINQEAAIKTAEIARKEAIFNKVTSAAQAAVDTAAAVAKALPNIPLSIAVGALGAIQVGTILAQPLPPIPSFATGGSFTVPPGFSDDSFQLPAAMVQSGERVTVETREQQAISGGADGDQMMTIQLVIDGRNEAERVARYINNGQVRLEVGA